MNYLLCQPALKRNNCPSLTITITPCGLFCNFLSRTEFGFHENLKRQGFVFLLMSVVGLLIWVRWVDGLVAQRVYHSTAPAQQLSRDEALPIVSFDNMSPIDPHTNTATTNAPRAQGENSDKGDPSPCTTLLHGATMHGHKLQNTHLQAEKCILI